MNVRHTYIQCALTEDELLCDVEDIHKSQRQRLSISMTFIALLSEEKW